MSRLDWPGLLHIGCRRLGLRPAEFWALTPAELMLMMGLGADTTPLPRTGLDELARAYPDETKGEADGGA